MLYYAIILDNTMGGNLLNFPSNLIKRASNALSIDYT